MTVAAARFNGNTTLSTPPLFLTRGQTCVPPTPPPPITWSGEEGPVLQHKSALSFSLPLIREPSEAAATARLRVVSIFAWTTSQAKMDAAHPHFSVSNERNMIELDLHVIIAKWWLAAAAISACTEINLHDWRREWRLSEPSGGSSGCSRMEWMKRKGGRTGDLNSNLSRPTGPATLVIYNSQAEPHFSAAASELCVRIKLCPCGKKVLKKSSVVYVALLHSVPVAVLWSETRVQTRCSFKLTAAQWEWLN